MTKKKIYLIVAGGGVMLLLLSLVLVFGRPADGANTDFVPGIYAGDAQNEFCSIKDTLIIRRKNPGSNDYGITRNSCFQRVLRGQKGPPEYQQQQWPATYEPKRHWLTQEGRADTIVYSPGRNRMYKGGFVYEKLE